MLKRKTLSSTRRPRGNGQRDKSGSESRNGPRLQTPFEIRLCAGEEPSRLPLNSFFELLSHNGNVFEGAGHYPI